MNNTKKTIEYVNKTKQDAMRFLAEAQEDVAIWTMVINECDSDLKAISQKRPPMYGKARITVMAAIALFLAILWCAGCNTVSGFGRDVTAVSDGFREQMAKGK